MKRLITALPTGLMPVYKSDLTTIQDNLYSALLALCKANDPGYSFILSGMTYSVSGGNALIAAGYWWRHDSNEIIYFPGGIAVGLSCYVAKTTSVFTNKTYKDGSSQIVYEETVSNLSSASLSPNPPTNAIQYTGIGTTGTLQDFQQIVRAWANKNTAWANVSFLNSWSYNGAGYQVQIRKNTNGIVMMRGVAFRLSGASGLSPFTIPIGSRPPRDFTIPVYNGAGFILVQFAASGVVTPVSTDTLYFDNIFWTTD